MDLSAPWDEKHRAVDERSKKGRIKGNERKSEIRRYGRGIRSRGEKDKAKEGQAGERMHGGERRREKREEIEQCGREREERRRKGEEKAD